MRLFSPKRFRQTGAVMKNAKLLVALTIPVLAAAPAADATAKQALAMALQATGKQLMVFQWKQRVTVIRIAVQVESFDFVRLASPIIP
jgi:hypothetical protein